MRPPPHIQIILASVATNVANTLVTTDGGSRECIYAIPPAVAYDLERFQRWGRWYRSLAKFPKGPDDRIGAWGWTQITGRSCMNIVLASPKYPRPRYPTLHRVSQTMPSLLWLDFSTGVLIYTRNYCRIEFDIRRPLFRSVRSELSLCDIAVPIAIRT